MKLFFAICDVFSVAFLIVWILLCVVDCVGVR